MSILSFLFGRKPKTAAVAKERLQLIIARERGLTSSSAPDYLPAMQKELIEVISRYVKVNPEDIKVSLEKQDNYEVLEVNIVLPDSSGGNGAARDDEGKKPILDKQAILAQRHKKLKKR